MGVMSKQHTHKGTQMSADYVVHIKGTPTVRKYYSGGGGDYYEVTKQSVVAFEGRVRVVGYADGFFGGDESREYRSRILVNPTWGTLFRVFKSQMRKTKDYHHSFLEGARIVRREVDKDGVSYGVVELSLGS
jgi:hypothetical protein